VTYSIKPFTWTRRACLYASRRYLSWRYPQGYIRVHGVTYDIPTSGVALTIPGGAHHLITDCRFIAKSPE